MCNLWTLKRYVYIYMPRLRKPYTYRTLFGGILKKDWSDVFYRKYFEKKPWILWSGYLYFVIFGLVLDTKASKLTKVKIKKTAHFLSGCIFSQFFPRSLHRFRCRYLNVKIYCTYLFFNFLVKLCYKVVYLGKIIMSNIAPPLLLFH